MKEIPKVLDNPIVITEYVDNNNDAVDIRVATKSEVMKKKNGRKRHIIDELSKKITTSS